MQACRACRALLARLKSAQITQTLQVTDPEKSPHARQNLWYPGYCSFIEELFLVSFSLDCEQSLIFLDREYLESSRGTKAEARAKQNLSPFLPLISIIFLLLAARGSEKRRTTARGLCFLEILQSQIRSHIRLLSNIFIFSRIFKYATRFTSGFQSTQLVIYSNVDA